MKAVKFHGLFYREGAIIGKEIAFHANNDRESYFDSVKSMLEEKGWGDSFEFNGDKIGVDGSIEADSASMPTCHRLRGILKSVYEIYEKAPAECTEIECTSAGGDRCVFEIKMR